MARKRNSDYSVGYGKPPIHSRFQKGQSGNPKGRRKGSKNLSTLMERALDEPVTIKENGSQKIITKREAFLKQLVKKAASGDLRSIQLAINYLQQLESRAEPSTSNSECLGEEDEALITGILERFKGTPNEGKSRLALFWGQPPSRNSSGLSDRGRATTLDAWSFRHRFNSPG